MLRCKSKQFFFYSHKIFLSQLHFILEIFVLLQAQKRCYFYSTIMRLHLNTTANNELIPFNYQQKLVGVLHKWLGEDNDEHGEVSLYSFSWLRGTKKEENGLVCPRGAKWFVSFYDEEKARMVLKSIRENPEMFSGLYITEIIIEETPNLSHRDLFYVGSPILVKRMDEKGVHEYGYNDAEANIQMTETLRNKMIKAGLEPDDSLEIKFDLTFEKKRQKLMWYRNISNMANVCPIIIKGKESTKQFAWNVGVGNCTGIGFGSIY